MSKAAIGNRQLAIGQKQEKSRCVLLAHNAARFASTLPIAYRLFPIAILPAASSDIANPCTVTPFGTSVTNLPLAHSVLIDVGKLALERGPEKRIWPTFRLALRVPHCSLPGGACI